ncbi:MAG: hypothetical protein K2K44_07690 [Oscillospiraceae bacterium]|nr:hypothetical protein [Oscillospiraceae bacterium]
MQINNIQSGANAAVYGVRANAETSEEQPKKIDELAEKPRARDEYVPSANDEPIGIYKLSEDEDGNPIIDFDKAEDGRNSSPEKSKNDDPEKKTESCTCNTDRVDREINQLKEKQEQLEQRLRSAEGEAARQLEKQLESVSAELALKDNDAYRRQQAVFS